MNLTKAIPSYLDVLDVAPGVSARLPAHPGLAAACLPRFDAWAQRLTGQITQFG